MTEKTRDPLVTVKDLHVEFDVRDGIVHAVDGCSFNIYRGQTLGIIGESGCGKSITAKAIMNMVPKPGKMKGEITFYEKSDEDGGEIVNEIRLDQTDPDGETIRKIRGGHIAMIFQEPMSSLTPVYSAGFHIMEAVNLHRQSPHLFIPAPMRSSLRGCLPWINFSLEPYANFGCPLNWANARETHGSIQLKG